MNKKYLKIVNLSVSENLAKFINKELLPGTKINKEKFWKGFDKCVHELAPKNKKLLQKRERLQKAIDALHIDKKSNKHQNQPGIHPSFQHAGIEDHFFRGPLLVILHLSSFLKKK